MRLTPALERLAGEIAAAEQHGLSAGPEKIRAWSELARAVLDEAVSEWLSEAAFRLRTGAHPRWCRRHFAACLKAGVARTDGGGRREWHTSARPPLAKATDAAARVQEIVASFAVQDPAA